MTSNSNNSARKLSEFSTPLLNCPVFHLWLILFVCHFKLFLLHFCGAAHFFPWGFANDLTVTLKVVRKKT